MSGPITSIIIPCHGQLKLLKRAVASILESCRAFDEETELLLVDDCSPVPVDTVLGELAKHPFVRIIKLEQNNGPSAARNVGIEASEGEYLLFTDDDVVVAKSWVRELTRYLKQAPSKVVGVGGRVLAIGNDLISRYYEYHHILDPFIMDDGTVLYLVTCNCAYRKSAIQEAGGFDEELIRPGGEDPGLSFKLTAQGYRLHKLNEALVWHDFRSGWFNFIKTFMRYGQGCRHQVDRYWIRRVNPAIKTTSTSIGGLELEMEAT